MSRLIVKNLPKSITEDKIRSLFSQKGHVTDIQLKYTKDGKFRQFGFIGFKTSEEADAAIQFFDRSCINTTKITVEKCVNLGDATKPKSWSKYSADSSAYKKDHAEVPEEKVEENEEEIPKTKKTNKIKELLEKYKDEPMFEEFMQLHGTQDLNALLGKLEENEQELGIQDEIQDDEDQNEDDSGNESTNEIQDKVANKKISDLEYMKLLMYKSTQKKEPRKRTEKQPKVKVKLYTVKLRGLPYACKKKDIKQFFSPLVPYTIRIPAKIKGFAYAGFKTEKNMNQALHKDKSFIAGKRICVFKYTSNDDQLQGDEQLQGEEGKKTKWLSQEEALKHEEDIAESGRIFLRNLSYVTTEDDIQQLFSTFGPITEVNLPIDKNTRKLKGFGVITFLMPEHAVRAYSNLDGTVFHGRMLHLLPGKAKDTPDDIDNMEGLTFKQKKALKEKAQSGSSHNWNSLFMGHNAVAEVIAETYGTSKEQVLDGRGKGSAAVRLALGETQIIAQTKQFLENSGVQLDVFSQPITKRSKTIILVKNLPAQTQPDQIQKLFAPHGVIGRIVLPPSGVSALVEFLEPSEARKAFTKLAYSKFINAPLYLEWAPENSFNTPPPTRSQPIEKAETPKQEKVTTPKPEKISTPKQEKPIVKDESESDEEEPEDDTTLFVKNLNFTTNENELRKHFETCGKLNYVSVALKKDPHNPGQKLSMGYGFVRFQYKNGADKALKTLQQSNLNGKALELKRSERTLQSEAKSAKKTSKSTKQNGTKILVRNIPFQANINEINELFKAFGEIKALRLPKRLTLGAESHRGFGFVDYTTKSDAKRAFQALCQSTHLYGRRLVLEWAASEEGVEEIRKRTAKHFHPTEEVRSKKSTLDADGFIGS